MLSMSILVGEYTHDTNPSVLSFFRRQMGKTTFYDYGYDSEEYVAWKLIKHLERERLTCS